MTVSDNVWEGLLEQPLESTTVNAIPFFEKRCQELEEATKGRIRARFCEIKVQYPVAVEALKSYAETSRANLFSSAGEADPLNLKRADEAYSPKRYAFDIYNNTYEFRPLIACIGATYPIKFEIDETIADEESSRLWSWRVTNENGFFTVCDDENLERLFGIVIESKKMRYVLHLLNG